MAEIKLISDTPQHAMLHDGVSHSTTLFSRYSTVFAIRYCA
ncbi:hypothetical protein EDWATA_04053 [Edwardsiella tarda ATCC 23685]|uniref:Uncharacterized protein n=1 Tax=Edwardsiella tarda ATCC 23685 TaxID=500638 RepID=D4FB82_EDWTA|nr:hypothetical protein EDWATA_04053 [Edwardsiella tarda ATCC 23685]